MATKKKGVVQVVTLRSQAGTGTVYHTVKNTKNTTEKLTARKYDRVSRKHEEFIETKTKSGKSKKGGK